MIKRIKWIKDENENYELVWVDEVEARNRLYYGKKKTVRLNISDKKGSMSIRGDEFIFEGKYMRYSLSIALVDDEKIFLEMRR